MKPEYYVSGSEESYLIFDEVFNDIKPRTIETMNQEGLPILICGNGTEHAKSHKLSERVMQEKRDRLKSINNEEYVKIVFDQHDDLYSSKEIRYDSHIYHTLQQALFSEIFIFGVIHNHHCHDKEINFSRSFDKAYEIKDKKIQISVDMDVLKVDYTSPQWSRGKENIENLTQAIKALKTNNELIAFDICGLSPFDSFDSEFNYVLEKDAWIKYKGFNREEVRIGEEKKIAPSFYQGIKDMKEILSTIRTRC